MPGGERIMNKQNNIVGYALVTIGMVLASAA